MPSRSPKDRDDGQGLELRYLEEESKASDDKRPFYDRLGSFRSTSTRSRPYTTKQQRRRSSLLTRTLSFLSNSGESSRTHRNPRFFLSSPSSAAAPPLSPYPESGITNQSSFVFLNQGNSGRLRSAGDYEPGFLSSASRPHLQSQSSFISGKHLHTKSSNMPVRMFTNGKTHHYYFLIKFTLFHPLIPLSTFLLTNLKGRYHFTKSNGSVFNTNEDGSKLLRSLPWNGRRTL